MKDNELEFRLRNMSLWPLEFDDVFNKTGLREILADDLVGIGAIFFTKFSSSNNNYIWAEEKSLFIANYRDEGNQGGNYLHIQEGENALYLPNIIEFLGVELNGLKRDLTRELNKIGFGDCREIIPYHIVGPRHDILVSFSKHKE